MKRIDLRRDDGVAMTEFALVLPVLVLIIAGSSRSAASSSTGSRPTISPTRPPAGRRRPEPVCPGRRCRRQPRLVHQRSSSRDVKSASPSRRARWSANPARGEGAEAVLARPDPERGDDHDQGSVRRCGSSTSTANGTAPLHTRPATSKGGVLVSRRPRLHEQRGRPVIVARALMIPVFLLLGALVVDVGNWFTHDRQLQNRADAAAYAAGDECAKNWKPCVQHGNATLKQTTANGIADAARQYAGDPEASELLDRNDSGAAEHGDRKPVEPRRRHQLLRPELHETTRTTQTVSSRRRGSLLPPRTGTGFHLAGRRAVDGQIRVKERDLGHLRRDRAAALPLRARARVEVRPAVRGHNFLPLAIRTA